VPASAQAASDPAKREALAMTNQEAWKIYEKYLSAWNTTSVEERLKISNEVLSEKIEYQTARHDLSTGRSLVIEDMATFHKRFPGGHFEIGDVSSHHNVALLTWVIIQADGREFARGGDQITVGRNGQITKIITFAPSVKNPN
ncbi:nuclear transport factor 2 family protein, partial [Caulobacter sp.]|uniref:nuclear transport factor 2 family protein n=1 Tax=Caulobacter sp. TaxID=78 RepID=UPI002B469B68